MKSYAVPQLNAEDIVDTTGAGDAFVGGFFAQYLKGESFDKCVDCGIWSSQIVIKHDGCRFPKRADYV